MDRHGQTQCKDINRNRQFGGPQGKTKGFFFDVRTF